MTTSDLPQSLIELAQDSGHHESTPSRRFSIIVDEREVMVSRRIPEELVGVLGFIEWNKFCDRLDRDLKPLRNLIEKVEDQTMGDICRFKEQSAKTKALEAMQQSCMKLSKLYPSLDLTLYCPFHNPLVTNWHIQVVVSPDSVQNETHQASQPESAADPLPLTHQVSESASGDESDGGTGGSADAKEDSNDTTEDRDDDISNVQDDVKSNTYFGRAGKGVLGVDYIEHTVMPTDTLQGICLEYNISATLLKQANLMSGANDPLLLAPNRVIAIPKTKGFLARVQDTNSKDYKLTRMTCEFSRLTKKEATAYLELADWVLEDALQSAKDDFEWEKNAKDDF